MQNNHLQGQIETGFPVSIFYHLPVSFGVVPF